MILLLLLLMMNKWPSYHLRDAYSSSTPVVLICMKNDDDDLDDIIAAAELLNLPELIMVCNNIKSDEEFLNFGCGKAFKGSQ